MEEAERKLEPLYLDLLHISPQTSHPPKPQRGRPKAVNIARGHELEDRDALADEVISPLSSASHCVHTFWCPSIAC